MNPQKFSLILDQLAKQAFPDDIDPWVVFQGSLSKKEIAMRSRPFAIFRPKDPNKRLRRVFGIVFVLLAIITAVMMIPQGRALAEVVIQFFGPALATSFPVSEVGPEPTIAPTFVPQLKPAIIGEPGQFAPTASVNEIPSHDPACDDLSSLLSYHCQISLAEEKAGFDALEFAIDPKGLIFSRIDTNPVLKMISIEYAAIGGGGTLRLTQSDGELLTSTWDEVPSGEVSEVRIGKNPGEFAKGMFTVTGQEMKASWNKDAPIWRLRWREGGRLFELSKMGDPYYIEYINQDVLIQLAANLINRPVATNQPRAEYLTSIAQAEKLVPFGILAPTILPEGFTFNYASWDEDLSQLRLVYDLPGKPGTTGIIIFETLLDKTQPMEEKGEKVYINKYSGNFFNEANQSSLTWRNGEIEINLIVFSTEWYGGQFTKDQILEIGQGIK